MSLRELPLPQPGPGEVLLRVHASGINPSYTTARAAAIWDITAWCELGRLPHAVGEVFALHRIVQAHEAVEQRTVMGNVVVQID